VGQALRVILGGEGENASKQEQRDKSHIEEVDFLHNWALLVFASAASLENSPEFPLSTSGPTNDVHLTARGQGIDADHGLYLN
jgi:hypothetical protein